MQIYGAVTFGIREPLSPKRISSPTQIGEKKFLIMIKAL